MTKLGANDVCWCGSGKKYKRCHRALDRNKSGGSSLISKLFPKKKSPPAIPAHAVKRGKIGPWRTVPDHIPRPDYATTGKPRQRSGKLIKNQDQLERMRKACRAARHVLEVVTSAVAVGVTTDELDAIAHEEYIKLGGYPSTLNYHGYKKSLCTSVNEVICHGIPDSRALQEGDIINCDVTIYLDGMHGDCSKTVFVGDVDEESKNLVSTTYDSMMAGIETVRAGTKIRDIGRAIEQAVKGTGYSVVEAFVGHGIGETFHMDPQVPHYYRAGHRFAVQPGMTFTIEPMINLGVKEHILLDDNWTAITADYKRSAQFEHTILVTENGVEILTLAEGEKQPFKH